MIQDAGCEKQETGDSKQDAGCRLQDGKCRIQETEVRIQNISVSGQVEADFLEIAGITLPLVGCSWKVCYYRFIFDRITEVALHAIYTAVYIIFCLR